MIETTWFDVDKKYDKISAEQIHEIARAKMRQIIKDAADDVDTVLGNGTADAHPELVAGATQVMATLLQTITVILAIQRAGESLIVELNGITSTLNAIHHSRP